MPAPSSSLATLRPDLAGLEEFDLLANQRGAIAMQVFPPIEADSAAGTYGTITAEQLLKQSDVQRSPSGDYNEDDVKFTTAPYVTQEYGIKERVDDNESTRFGNYFDWEAQAARRARHKLISSMETKVAAKIFDATNYTGASLTLAITNEWDDATNAVPITDVEVGFTKMFANIGMYPNALIVNYKVFRNLRNCAQIVDRCKAQSFMDVRPEAITAAMLATALGVDQVLVAGMALNSAVEGQSAAFAHHWSNEYAALVRIARTNDMREPCIGRLIHWMADGSVIDGLVETYRDEDRRADMVRARHQFVAQRVMLECGFLFSNVTT